MNNSYNQPNFQNPQPNFQNPQPQPEKSLFNALFGDLLLVVLIRELWKYRRIVLIVILVVCRLVIEGVIAYFAVRIIHEIQIEKMHKEGIYIEGYDYEYVYDDEYEYVYDDEYEEEIYPEDEVLELPEQDTAADEN